MNPDPDPVAEPRSIILYTSDIARAVGVHPNTVRLYEEWGYLPSIPRSTSGYRQFNAHHLAQMRLARLALADPFPGRHVRRSLAAIVRLGARGDHAQALESACEHQALVRQEIAQAEAAVDYLEQWASGELAVEDQHPGLLSGETADLLHVSKDTLRHWERNGLIDPPREAANRYRRYGPQDIGRLRVLRLLTRAGYSTMAVLRVVRTLDHGRPTNLGELLDSPAEDEDIVYASDRWLTTLRLHDERSAELISQLRAMISLVESTGSL